MGQIMVEMEGLAVWQEKEVVKAVRMACKSMTWAIRRASPIPKPKYKVEYYR